MPESRKIVCLGGGSLYFKHAVSDLLVNPDLAGSEIVLYDLDLEKVQVMSAGQEALAEQAGTGMTVRATDDLADALDGADFAISSIGGSGAAVSTRVYQSPYHASDIRIPAKYGIQQIVGDTCGPAGMMMGLRAVPAYLAICHEMEKRCPQAILLNHSNPMAVLCRAMVKYSSINTIGICHGVQGGIRYAAGILDLEPRELAVSWVGTNHYYWLTRIMHRGQDLYPELMRRVRETEAPQGKRMTRDLSLAYGYQVLYPSDDHAIEFYPWMAQVGSPSEMPYDMSHEAQERWDDLPGDQSTSAQPGAEVREAFMREYRELVADPKLPAAPSDGLVGEGVGEMIAAIAHGRRLVCIANIPNGGCVRNLPAHALLEVEAVTDSAGVRGVQMGDAPPLLKGMLEKRIVWQELVADAAVTGDRDLVVQACLLDEASIPPDRTQAMVDELLAASKDLLPQFNL
jgi:alpha-galactosidase